MLRRVLSEPRGAEGYQRIPFTYMLVGSVRERPVPPFARGKLIAVGRLEFATQYADAVSRADFMFICVNTPPGSHGGADMTLVRQAARSIGRALRPNSGMTVVNKSTMPIGRDEMVLLLHEETADGAHIADEPGPTRDRNTHRVSISRSTLNAGAAAATPSQHACHPEGTRRPQTS
jgi:hypothetical protein